MAAVGNGQGLQALIDSFSPEIFGRKNENGDKLTPRQIEKLSDKLNEIMGQPSDQNRNESGELVNEEGLPIVDITEPLHDPESATQEQSFIEEPDLIQLVSLSQSERQRLRAERDAILDMLEEEERREQHKVPSLTQEQKDQLLQKRKDAARVEAEKLKTAKALQKKMGKALLQTLSDDREKEDKPRSRASGTNSKKKAGKNVSFAGLPSDMKASSINTPPRSKVGAIPLVKSSGVQLPMKMHIIERFPRTSTAAHSGKPVGSSPSVSPTQSGLDDGAHKKHELSTNVDVESDTDTDRAQTKVGIATEYYKKRESIGEKASGALTSPSRLLHDQWNQPEVPLEATLSSPPPKPRISRFRADLHSHNPMAPTSLESSVIPVASAQYIQRAIRMGKLEGDKLIAVDDSNSENEAETIKDALEKVKHSNLQNVSEKTQSADQSTAISIPSNFPAAIEAQPNLMPMTVSRTNAQSNPQISMTSGVSSPTLRRGSGGFDRQLSDRFEPLTLPSGPTTPDAPPRSSTSLDISAPSRPSATSSFPMIIDSPSFAPPRGNNKPETKRPDRPPMVMSSVVREAGSAGPSDRFQARSSPAQRRVSRFKAERG